MEKVKQLENLFELTFHEDVVQTIPLKGDGSERKIYRILNSHRSVIGIVGNNRSENRAFIAFSRHFLKNGLPVPEIYAEASDCEIYLEEDLGDLTLFDWVTEIGEREGFSEQIIQMYRKVLNCLPQFQIHAGQTIDYSLCYQHHEFGWASMVWDVHYFQHRFLDLFYKKPYDVGDLEKDFIALIEYLISEEKSFFLYRDFQSRNIMLRNGEPHFIDYQSGRKGALQYDVASILYDAKANIPEPIREQLLNYYMDQVALFRPVDRNKFIEFFYGYVLIRIMQACGAYGYLGMVKGKKTFLKSVPFAIRNLEILLEKDIFILKQLPTLREIMTHLVKDESLRNFDGDDQ